MSKMDEELQRLRGPMGKRLSGQQRHIIAQAILSIEVDVVRARVLIAPVLPAPADVNEADYILARVRVSLADLRDVFSGR